MSRHFTSRRDFLAVAALVGAGQAARWGDPEIAARKSEQDSRPDASPQEITIETVRAAELILGIELTNDERKMLLGELRDGTVIYRRMRDTPIANALPPAFAFSPMAIARVDPKKRTTALPTDAILDAAKSSAPKPPDRAKLFFSPISHLAAWLRRGELTAVDLARAALDRLREFDPKLHCVVSLCEERALREAVAADSELSAGKSRGLLHGIPWAAKDIIAAKGTKTTWGAKPLKDQVIDEDAAVVEKLGMAGAVLVAKVTTGALALGDRWFGGLTRNPWNIEQGSSGSSAGPASAVAAGLIPFAIGSETLGSIVSPCTRCGVTGLRPTFGRFSRRGVMTLSWTMDKLGPIVRYAEDAALVAAAIGGKDPADFGSIDISPNYRRRDDLDGCVIGLLKSDGRSGRGAEFESARAKFDDLGAKFVEFDLPSYRSSDMMSILTAESGSAFDDFTLKGLARELDDQGQNDWPNTFRAARFIPAVEYLRAMRLRTRLVEDMENRLLMVDAILSGPYEQDILGLTNLSGHPAIVFPIGFRRETRPMTATLIGRFSSDDDLVAMVDAYQRSTDWHQRTPTGF